MHPAASLWWSNSVPLQNLWPRTRDNGHGMGTVPELGMVFGVMNMSGLCFIGVFIKDVCTLLP
jgi:hypothetical protein